MSSARHLVLLLVLSLLCCTVLAEPTPGPEVNAPRVAWLKKHALAFRTIDPADEDFSDLEPLRKVMGEARIVQLGEQSHGDGATFHAKARLIKFLHQKMGFDVLAVESGLYDCRKAWSLLREGKGPYEAVSHGVFGIWTSSEQFQPVIDYLGKNARAERPLELCGFDCQLTASASAEHLRDDVEAVLGKLGAKALPASTRDTLVQAVDDLVKDADTPPDEVQEPRRKALAAFGRALADAQESDNFPAAELAFWRQFAVSLANQAESHWATAEGEKGEKRSLNLRDTQMARNLVWLAREVYPKRKIIVWAASYHLMRHPAVVQPLDEELGPNYYRGTVTMGDEVWKALGKETYTLAFIAAEGKAGLPWAMPFELQPMTAGSLEDLFYDAEHKFAVVNFRDLDESGAWLRQKLTSRPLGHSDMAANWTEVFDGIVFTRTMYPSTLTKRAMK
jgi:erythromycin esterase